MTYLSGRYDVDFLDISDVLISVIIPVYNTEAYLDQCVCSVIQQTHKKLQIILVDDGSTDSSGNACDRWAREDSRIKVIHKENGGLSSARNRGIDEADAMFIGFVDSDDYISSDMYERLLKNLIEKDADISCCAAVDVYKNKTLNVNVDKAPYILDGREFYISCISRKEGNCVGVWNKLYKKSVFFLTRFKENLLVEDYYILPELVLNITHAVMEPFCGYFYFHRSSGITGNYRRNAEKQIHDRIAGCRHNEKLLGNSESGLSDCVKEMNLTKYFVICRIYEQSQMFSDKNEIRKLKKELRKNLFIILSSKVVGIRFKRSYIIWFLCPALYTAFYRRIENRRSE